MGKSEVAIELIQRGHRIIADDAVEIRQTNHGALLATAPELIRHYMELRGIGVVDVRRLFGMTAIKTEQEIDLVIKLEPGTTPRFTTVWAWRAPPLRSWASRSPASPFR